MRCLADVGRENLRLASGPEIAEAELGGRMELSASTARLELTIEIAGSG